MVLYLTLASLFIMVASLAGVLSLWKSVGAFIERNLRFLVSFSAGVFLVVSLELSLETLDNAASMAEGLGWILVGAAVLLLLFRLWPQFHHHHDRRVDDHQHKPLDIRRILAGDAIHNLGDGILLLSAFAVSPVFGMLTAVGIFLHELVQEISEFFVLRRGGFSTSLALGINFLVSGTILLGSLGGLFVLHQTAALEVPLLGIAAGSFLVVVFHDLIPHSVRSSRTKVQYAHHLTVFVIGLLTMWSISAVTADTHSHQGPDTTEHNHQEHLDHPADDHTHEGTIDSHSEENSGEEHHPEEDRIDH